MFEDGLDNSTCPKTKCIRHGKCRECIAYHEKKDNLPRCKREKESVIKKLFITK